MSGPSVLLTVHHLMGSGHLARTAAIARALAARGARAVVASGGRPLPHLDLSGVDLIQLPPVATDGVDYSTLYDADGRVADAAHMAARRARLLAALEETAPDVLVTELFPFGRRILAAEFEALLSAAARRARPPRILASVRDLPEPPRKEKRVAEAEARLARWYSGVLVHGEERVAPLWSAWPATPPIRALLTHTGYVADPLPDAAPEGPGAGEVIVAGGGGAAALGLLDLAARAARASDLHWRLLAPTAEAAARLPEAPNVTAQALRADYRALLQRAAVSVSRLGYNTACDLLASGIPAVVIPFTGGGEREQSLRAQAFANLPGIETLDAPTPHALAAAVARAAGAPRAQTPFPLDGADRAARAILDMT